MEHIEVTPALVAAATRLDMQLRDPDGRIRVLPAADLRDTPQKVLRYWCHIHGVYGLPTVELVEYIRHIIGDRAAIEIGSGNGALGRALCIPRTDSRIQDNPEVAGFYRLTGQPRVEYGADIERYEALEAVEAYKPQVVVGSWITQRHAPGDKLGSAHRGCAVDVFDFDSVYEPPATAAEVRERLVQARNRIAHFLSKEENRRAQDFQSELAALNETKRQAEADLIENVMRDYLRSAEKNERSVRMAAWVTGCATIVIALLTAVMIWRGLPQ